MSGILAAPQQADEAVAETVEQTVPEPITIDQLIQRQQEKISKNKTFHLCFVLT